MSNENGIVYADKSAATEGLVNAREVAVNLQSTGVVVGTPDSEMERVASGGDEGSLNFNDISKGLGKSGIEIHTGTGDEYNPDEDPHLKAFIESQKVD